jgi:antitoxin VapB
MALNIKNPEVERLASELAEITGESKTEAVRKALEQRKASLSVGINIGKRDRWIEFLESEIWPAIPREQLGRRLSKEEEEAIHRRYGKGRHKANLDFGDCLAYSVAKLSRLPLLFVGNDFAETDLETVGY